MSNNRACAYREKKKIIARARKTRLSIIIVGSYVTKRAHTLGNNEVWSEEKAESPAHAHIYVIHARRVDYGRRNALHMYNAAGPTVFLGHRSSLSTARAIHFYAHFPFHLQRHRNLTEFRARPRCSMPIYTCRDICLCLCVCVCVCRICADGAKVSAFPWEESRSPSDSLESFRAFNDRARGKRDFWFLPARFVRRLLCGKKR